MIKDPENQLKCGTVSIVGRPNVGKSTLLNRILGEKVAIVSNVPQTTRNKIRGIYNDERGQIIFVDTPGLFLGKDKLDKMLLQSSVSSLEGADCIIHLVDSSERTGKEEEALMDHLKGVKLPVVLGLNKVDLKGKNIPDYIDLWEKCKGQSVHDMKAFTILPLSSKTGVNVDKLIDIIFDYLPQGPALYPGDILSDTPQKLTMADVIREKFLQVMREEIPHSISVVIENVQKKRKKVLYINALVFVERDTQKEIVIGKKGQVLKNIGTLARKELEDILERKVFLELHVKVQKNWRDNVSLLQEMGCDL